MTTEDLKAEVIRKAYGEYWETVYPYLNTEGWCLKLKGLGFDEINQKIPVETRIRNREEWRPLALHGIETNNGWTVIEPDGSNLPIFPDEFQIIHKEYRQSIGEAFYSNNEASKVLWLQMYSHYKPIPKKIKPIF